MVALALRTDRSGLAALPLGCVLRGPRPAGAGIDAGPRRAAGPDGAGGRADRRRPAQGLRPSRPGRHPADLDDRLPSPEGSRSGDRAAPRTPAGGGLRVARGRRGGVLVRRRLGEPLHRGRRDQHRARHGLRGLPVPILFVCEDNGFGISVPTPAGWIEAAYGSRPGLAYVVRRRLRSGGRLAGDRARPRTPYASSDDRSSCTCGPYASEATPAATPRSATANRGRSRRTTPVTRCWPRRRACVRPAPSAGDDPGSLRRHPRSRSTTRSTSSRTTPQLSSAAEVMAPIAPRRPDRVADDGDATASEPATDDRASDQPRTLAESINATLGRAAGRRPPSDRLRRGRRRQGRGLRRHRAVLPASMERPESSTPCSTSSRFSVLGWAPGWPG